MKSPNARRAYAYGPPVRGNARPRLANTSASRTAPAPVNTHPSIETGPAVPASVAGSRKTPEPTMLPTTRAVAIHRPIVRLSFGAPLVGATDFDCGGAVIGDLLSKTVSLIVAP